MTVPSDRSITHVSSKDSRWMFNRFSPDIQLDHLTDA